MCILCVIQDAAKEVQQRNKVKVGVISQQLREDFTAHKRAEALADLDVDQLVLNVRRAIVLGEMTEAEADVRTDEIEAQKKANEEKYAAEHEALWNRVHDELPELDRDINYSLEPESGVVKMKRRRQEFGNEGAGQHVH